MHVEKYFLLLSYVAEISVKLKEYYNNRITNNESRIGCSRLLIINAKMQNSYIINLNVFTRTCVLFN